MIMSSFYAYSFLEPFRGVRRIVDDCYAENSVHLRYTLVAPPDAERGNVTLLRGESARIGAFKFLLTDAGVLVAGCAEKRAGVVCEVVGV